jgi:hypothetical protein
VGNRVRFELIAARSVCRAMSGIAEELWEGQGAEICV